MIDRPGALGVTLITWRRIQKGSLRGYATVQLRGLIFSDCPVVADPNGAWARLPSLPVLDDEGRQARDDRGKLVFRTVAKWANWTQRAEFSDAVVAAVERDYPGDLREDAA